MNVRIDKESTLLFRWLVNFINMSIKLLYYNCSFFSNNTQGIRKKRMQLNWRWNWPTYWWNWPLMYRIVKCPADEAAGTQRLARPDFPSLGRCRSVSRLRSSTQNGRPQSGGPRSREGTGMNGKRADRGALSRR